MYFHLALIFNMRYLILFIGCFISLNVAAQKPFEGVIAYTLHATGEKKDAALTVYFTPNKLKIIFKENGKAANDYMLVNLDSGKVYNINKESKSYRVKSLTKKEKREGLTGKTIAGYATIPMDLSGGGFNGLLGGLSSGDIIFYTAENLVYPIPKQYAGNSELAFIQDNKIVLGADITLAYPLDEGDSVQKELITVTATEVLAKPIDKAELEIPHDFARVIRSPSHYSDIDSVSTDTLVLDNIIEPAAPKVKEQVKKNAPATPKKVTNTRAAANKRKQE
jgi:hypothetical protein